MLLARIGSNVRNAVSLGHVRYQSSLSKDELSTLLSKPTWSVRSLLPDGPAQEQDVSPHEITPAQLRHLLRLSALPQPRSLAEEADMLKTLSSQIHFVKEVQAVDTTGVESLRALRDETANGIKEATVGLDQLKEFLGKEEVIGRNKRIRRNKMARDSSNQKREIPDWNPLEMAQEKRGRFFVVKRDKDLEKQHTPSATGVNSAS